MHLENLNIEDRFSEEFYYSPNHIWISVDETLVTMGITHLIPNKLGELLFFDAPEVGDRVAKDTSFGSLESVKDWAALISPVSGLIVEVNMEVVDEPFLLNDDSYENGWILRVEIESEKELIDLIRAADYRLLSVK